MPINIVEEIRPVSINEQIHELRQTIEMLPRETPTEVRESYQESLSDAEWRASEYARISGAVCQVANRHRDEQERELADLRRMATSKAPMTFDVYEKLQTENIHRTIPDPRRLLDLNTCTDVQQRLVSWTAELIALELATRDEIRAIGITIGPNPAYRKQQEKDRQEHERKIQVRDQILRSITDKWQQQEARTLFNILGGPLTDGKISQWIQDCVSHGILPFEYRAGAKVGAFIHRLLRGEEQPGGEFFK